MATHSFGTTLEMDPTNATTYAAIAAVVSITPPELETTASNSTHLTSANAIKEFLPGLIDPGELECVLRFTRAQYTIFMANLRKIMSFRMKFPDTATGTTTNGSTLTFSGMIRTLGGPTVGEDDTINQTVRFKVSGPVTFLAGTG